MSQHGPQHPLEKLCPNCGQWHIVSDELTDEQLTQYFIDRGVPADVAAGAAQTFREVTAQWHRGFSGVVVTTQSHAIQQAKNAHQN